MKLYKRLQLKKREIIQLREVCENYIWAAIDPQKCIISLGDDYLADLRDVLLVHRCNPEDIFGIGFDLETGEINYAAQINRRNPTVNVDGELSPKDKENIEHALHYFFEKLPIYSES